jgi:hypothetical protein
LLVARTLLTFERGCFAFRHARFGAVGHKIAVTVAT